jgi:hypothetical protein
MAAGSPQRTMLGMITPIVTEMPLRMEPVTVDSFVETVERDVAVEVTLPQLHRRRAGTSPRSRHGLRRRIAPMREAALAA